MEIGFAMRWCTLELGFAAEDMHILLNLPVDYSELDLAKRLQLKRNPSGRVAWWSGSGVF